MKLNIRGGDKLMESRVGGKVGGGREGRRKLGLIQRDEKRSAVKEPALSCCGPL